MEGGGQSCPFLPEHLQLAPPCRPRAQRSRASVLRLLALCFLVLLLVVLQDSPPLSRLSGRAALPSPSHLVFSVSPPPSNSHPALVTPFWGTAPSSMLKSTPNTSLQLRALSPPSLSPSLSPRSMCVFLRWFEDSGGHRGAAW